MALMQDKSSTLKQALTLASLCLLGIAAAFVMAEFYLRYRADRIQKSNNLEIGMVKYDRLLGWKLPPGWFPQPEPFLPCSLQKARPTPAQLPLPGMLACF